MPFGVADVVSSVPISAAIRSFLSVSGAAAAPGHDGIFPDPRQDSEDARRSAGARDAPLAMCLSSGEFPGGCLVTSRQGVAGFGAFGVVPNVWLCCWLSSSFIAARCLLSAFVARASGTREFFWLRDLLVIGGNETLLWPDMSVTLNTSSWTQEPSTGTNAAGGQVVVGRRGRGACVRAKMGVTGSGGSLVSGAQA